MSSARLISASLQNRAGSEARALGPIHIGGLDRSGKTTMQAFLTSHPRIAIPGVGSNMWTYFYGRFGSLSAPENLERCLDALLSYSHVRSLEPDRERILREFQQGPATYARLFSYFLIHYAQRQGKPRWGEQTGLIERYADEIFEAHPGAKIIHMMRDPRDRYEASLALWPAGRGRAGAATARWNYSLRLAERHLRRYSNDYLIVRFEDLVLHTQETLARVCRFIGEEFHPDMLVMSGAPERRKKLLDRARTDSSVRPSSHGLLSPRFIGRFHGRIPPSELAFIQLHARRGMRKFGYEPVPTRLSATDHLRFAARAWPSQMARMEAWRGMELLQQRFPSLFHRTPDPRTLVPHSGGER
jgi:hypothetical protein